jgi:hypothetical protein
MTLHQPRTWYTVVKERESLQGFWDVKQATELNDKQRWSIRSPRNVQTRQTQIRVLGEKPVLVPLCPPHVNLRRTGPRSKPCLRGEMPKTNSLTRGTVKLSLTFIQMTYRNSVPTSQRTEMVFIIKTDGFMLFRTPSLFFVSYRTHEWASLSMAHQQMH